MEHLEALGNSELRAQTRANLLWAFARTVPAMDTAVYQRIVAFACDPQLKLPDESALARSSSAVALARLHPVLDEQGQLTVQRWMERTSRQCYFTGVAQFKASELVVLLRSMMACHALHPRLLCASVRELCANHVIQLRPFELVMVVEMMALVQLEPVPAEFLEFLGSTVPRFSDFEARELVAVLWALQRIGRRSAHDLGATLAAGTAVLARSALSWPPEVRFSRKSQHEGDDEKPPDEAQPDEALQQDSVELTVREWMWVLNSVAPLSMGARGFDAPEWLLHKFVRRWCSWFERLVGDINATTAVFGAAVRSEHAQQSAALRYSALLQRDGVDSLGPRWTPVALQRLGICYGGAELPPAAQEAVARTRTAADGRTQNTLGMVAWLEARAQREDTGEELALELCAWSRSDGTDVPSDALVSAPLAGRDRGRHVEFRVLSQLAERLGAPGGWQGEALLACDGTPCISCLGAAAQLRQRWPGLALRVVLSRGEPSPREADAVEPRGRTHPVLELEAAVRAVLSASTKAPVWLLGTNRNVRTRWARICATGARPSGKGQAQRKREWHDKLKFFLGHRPASFVVEDGEIAMVKLAPAEAPTVEAFDALVAAVEGAVVELLKVGKGCDVGEGFVRLKDVWRAQAVREAWRPCRCGPSDKFAYFARHSEAFEVYDPKMDSGGWIDVDASSSKKLIRLWL